MNVKEILQAATEAANAAGAEWMADHTQPAYNVTDGGGRVVGQLLDLCGNASVVFTDRRCREFKAFRDAGVVRVLGLGTAVICVEHAYKYRQEYNLQKACARAAMDVLVQRGVTKIKIWEYID